VDATGVVRLLSFAAGASGGVEVAADVVVTGGEDVALWLSFAAIGALTITVLVDVVVRPL
jgi:hypothetical protein